MKNNRYIGTIIRGDNGNTKSNRRVIFKANGEIYIKNIREKNKIRRKKYVLSENVNIICDDLNNDYVYIDSDNQAYFNKAILGLIVLGIFIGIFACGITMVFYEQYFTFVILLPLGLVTILMFYFFYVILMQHKKLYKRCTETINGEIIDYSRTEYRHESNKTIHCKYNVMYKFKMPDGNIIHSVMNSYEAPLLYKSYPLNKIVTIKYNPEKCCESCLLDEYNSAFSNEKLVKYTPVNKMTIGTITGISVECIDEDVEEYLKQYYLIDYIECEYFVSDKKYKTISIFGVPHNRFKIGEEIRVFYENDKPDKFFADINKTFSNLDKIDY